MRELRTALIVAWVIVSSVLMCAVLTPFVMPSQTVFSLFPACEARLRGEPCVLCGMTTAFVRLSSFDIPGALEANRYSIAVWLASILNFAAAKAYILFRLVQYRSLRS